MAITRISYTQEIPGIKVKAASVAEANLYIGQVTQGELFEVNGELLFKSERNSTSLTPVGSGLVATGTIDEADVKTLNATPVVLIAAPGAGKAIIVDEIQLFLDYGAADYVAGAGEDIQIEYTGGVDIAAIDNDAVTFLTASADESWFGQPGSIYDAQAAGTGDGVLLTTIDNDSVQITILSGEVATGDSDIKYSVNYRIIDLLT